MTDACYRHPDRDAKFYCQKDGNYMCEECACCHSPRVYCQYRTACVIDILTKEGHLARCEEKSVAKQAADAPSGTQV